jgi:UDP-2,3-diacylglucosamine pyrophosphatase LpxH
MRKFKGYNLSNFHVKNELLLNLDGKKVWFFHGDVFDLMPGAGTYITRLGSVGFSFLLAVNRGVNWFRTKTGKTPISPAARLREHPEEATRLIRRFEKTSSDIAIRNGYDCVVCGHLHKPAKHWIETPSGKTLYLNSGDWVENLTALEYNFKRWKLYRYDEDKLSSFYADEDLKEMDINELISSIVSKKEKQETREEEKPSEE